MNLQLEQRKVFVCAAGFLLAFLLCPGVAWAQSGTAAIHGEVTDAQGGAVVGAKATVTNVGTQAVRTGQTDANGRYQFTALPPGIYTLRIEMAGFRTAVREKLELGVNTNTKLPVQLEVGAVTETMVVAEAATALNTVDSSVGNVITSAQVMNLPLEARNPMGLLTLQAGVAFSGDPTDPRSGSVNGGRSDQANVTLDGVDVNDQQTQNALTTAIQIPLESIMEFRFTTSNPTAEMGRSSGGQIGFITRSGTNDFHGSLFWTNRNRATAANDFFNNLNNSPLGKFNRNQYGGSLGGPLVKERLFFFVTYEGNKRRQDQAVNRVVPSDTLRQGLLLYRTSTGAVATLTQANLLTIDPARIGVNSAMLTYMQSFPRCNNNLVGLDTGLNFCGFRFQAPIPLNNDVWVAKFDWHVTRDAKHVLSWRGTYGDFSQDFTPQQFPGQPAAQKLLDNSKGFSLSYATQPLTNWTSVTRWGYTRLGREFSGQPGDSFGIRSFDTAVSFARATIRLIPTQNLVEDATWLKGKHTYQFGGNFRWISNDRSSFANSFATYSINDGFCRGLCNSVPNSLGPGNAFPQFAAVPSTSRNPFKRALMGLYGMITTISDAFIFNGTSSNLATGQGVTRAFRVREYELYGQDIWRLTRNLTLIYGVRYGYYGVPWEANGLQVQPTVDIQEWFASRVRVMNAGLPSATIPDLSWDLAGRANHRGSYYAPDRNNFAPNISFAYSPGWKSGPMSWLLGGNGKSVLRGGFRVVFDRVGGSFVVSQDLNGAVGLVTPISNRAGFPDYGGSPCTVPPTGVCRAPRFTGLTSLPSVANFVSAPSSGFPTTPAESISNRGFVIDNRLRTPYSYDVDVSFAREFKSGITLESAYVGRFGHKLLAKADIGAPLIYLVDNASHTTYAQAINQMYAISNAGALPTSAITTRIPYFENLFPGLAGSCGTSPPNCTATQGAYDLASSAFPSFTDALNNLEFSSRLAGPTFFQQQFDSLPAWTNWGRSNFHGWNLTLRKRFSRGFLFDFNYTWSKSIDNASQVENGARLDGQIADAFFPRNAFAISGFDLKHQLSSNWVYDLPFGRGRKFAGSASGVWNQIIGGWQNSGIFRWRGAFPISLENGFNFPTNFFLTGPGTQICAMDTGVRRNSPVAPNLFGSTDAEITRAFNCLDFTRSGSSGSRNSIRGARFFNVDYGLRKSFNLWRESHKLVFQWQVFNLTNKANFDDRTMRTNPESRETFGRYISTIGPDERNINGRVMQFSLRYEF